MESTQLAANKKEKKSNREGHFAFRVTKKEKDNINEAAKKTGFLPGAFVRRIVAIAIETDMTKNWGV